MPVIHDISTFRPKFTDTFLFDNNVWMFLYCPIANYEKKKQRAYSSLYSDLCTRNISIFITSLILSEFCNAWLRIEFNHLNNKSGGTLDYKKDFVPSPQFKSTVQDIKVAVTRILSGTLKNSDEFNAVNFDNITNEFGSCDFNDGYYLELARFKGWKIVTDDADFFKNNSLGIEIVTANLTT